jgi:hypothetical protein
VHGLVEVLRPVCRHHDQAVVLLQVGEQLVHLPG